MMRKVLSSLLVILMIVSIVGCSSSEPAETTAPTTQAPSTTAAPSTTVPDGSGDATETATEAAPFDAEGYVFMFGFYFPFHPVMHQGTSYGAELKAMYARIEDDLNCTFDFVYLDG